MKRFSPVEHELERKHFEAEQKALTQQKKEEEIAIKRAVNRVIDSEDGKLLWRWIFNRCGWTKPALSQGQTGGDLAPLRTECLAALRDFYRELRMLASADLRVKAEDFAENGTVAENKKGGK
jgi:hypothetical protein